MNAHNNSSSSDESWEKLAMKYDEFDVPLTDIDEAELVDLGRDKEVEHLSIGSFSSPPFPADGFIHGANIRYMIPLVCQRAGKPKSKAINIWFIIDSGSPFTCLSVKSLEALLGPGSVTNSFYSLAIQDQERLIECQVSKAHYQEVNILGANAMRDLELSILVDWRKKKFQLIRH